jgi:penicillin-binding protein 1A
VISADADEAEVYVGGGETRRLRLGQVKWARPFKTENWRGAAPKRVTDAVAVGDLIRLRQDDEQWVLAQVPKVGGALVALAPADGAIRALSGGYAFRWSKFNRATDTKRQPGSTFKPFVYAAALGKGYTPASLVKDERFEMPSRNGVWRPKNADGKFMGPIRIRVALSKSRNLAAVNLMDRMSVDHARAFIQSFGFAPESMPPDMSMALGSGAVSPLELARGFASFANGGYRIEPYLIARIEDVHGNPLFEAQPLRACMDCWIESDTDDAVVLPDGASDDPRAPLAIDPRIAYNMDSMLKDVIREGTATRARRLERPDIAGKTGTTNESRDSWFAGYQPELVAVAWVGRDDNTPLGRGEWGGTAALGIWIDFMEEALQGVPVAQIKRPEGMVPVRISLRSGQKTSSERNSRIEYIRDEYQLMTLGPDPVEYSAPVARRRTAPRMLDELF